MNPDWSRLPSEIWDAVIVGAGPAGGVVATQLAKRGWRVLLVEKSSWPREKVCGGCLSAAAVELLHEMRLGEALRGARRLEAVNWRVGRHAARIPVAGGAALLRSDLDAALVAIAVQRGCQFVSGVSARLLPDDCPDYRTLELRADANAINPRARIVMACDGIGGKFLAGEPWAKWRVARGAWMGVAATLRDGPDELASGNIYMYVGNRGYVGMVEVGNGLIHLAAALDPNACRDEGGPAELVRAILASCGQSATPNIGHLHGTGLLSRRRDKFSGNRVLAIGDACGYVEPFTGEGMAWAIASAREAAAMVGESPKCWPADLGERWTAQQYMEMSRRQRLCRALVPMVHHPTIAAGAVFLTRAMPALGKFIAGRTGHPRRSKTRTAYEAIQ